MKSKRCLYGLTGLLSLLGLIGVFTEAKSFLAFFAFAVDFESVSYTHLTLPTN